MNKNITNMEKQKKSIWFWILNALIAVIVVIFIIQNWGKVTFSFLGLKLEGYGFLVFLVIFILGFFSGWLWENLRRRKQQKMKDKAEDVHYLED